MSATVNKKVPISGASSSIHPFSTSFLLDNHRESKKELHLPLTLSLMVQMRQLIESLKKGEKKITIIIDCDCI